MFILSHKSALEFVRLQRQELGRAEVLRRVSNLESSVSDFSETLTFEMLPKPATLLVSQTQNRHHRHKVNFCSIKKLEKLAIFEKYDTDFAVPVAPMILCQIAKNLSVAKLLLVVLEFCGTYSHSQITNQTIYQLAPKTSKNQISKFFTWKKNTKIRISDSKKLEFVMRFAQDGAASPMEAIIFSMLVLPRRLGGFGVHNCVLNHKISMSNDGRFMTEKANLVADICLLNTKIIIEYDSHEFHSNGDKFEQDKIRRDCLSLEGWNVYTLTRHEVRNFDLFIIKIRKILSKAKIYYSRLPKNYYVLQKKLYFELLNS